MRLAKHQLLSRSAEGASLLVALQFSSRVLTFAVNQFLLRFLAPERLAIATQLEVYAITVLVFSRESLRVAVQRQPYDLPQALTVPRDEKTESRFGRALDARTAGGKTQSIVNLAHVSVYLGIIFASTLAWLYMNGMSAYDPSVLQTPFFNTALALYGLATFWELLSEPCFAVVQQKSQYRIRALTETVATSARCLVTCTATIWSVRTATDLGVLPFALGQGAYGLMISLTYYYHTWSPFEMGGFSLMPLRIASDAQESFVLSYLSRPLLNLSVSMFIQSIVKNILSQGDTLVITMFASRTAQGVYAVTSNYGGLVARLMLQPIEESCRNYFGKLLASASSSSSRQNIKEAQTSLQMLLRLYLLSSAVIVAVGPAIAPLIFEYLAGSRWSNSGAGQVLAIYCFYIPFLAINGVSEAFVASVATTGDINRQSMWMLVFSMGFGGAAFVFVYLLDMGATGLICANLLNMAMRIFWSMHFVSTYMTRHGSEFQVLAILPSRAAVAASVATYAILARVEVDLAKGLFWIIFQLGAILVVYALTLIFSEWAFLDQCYQESRGENPT